MVVQTDTVGVQRRLTAWAEGKGAEVAEVHNDTVTIVQHNTNLVFSGAVKTYEVNLHLHNHCTVLPALQAMLTFSASSEYA